MKTYKTNIYRLRRGFVLMLLVTAFSFCPGLLPDTHAQENNFRILVEGKPLTGMYVAPQKSGRRLLLPAAAIALALGDELKIDAGKETVFLRRQNGVTAEFDTRTNQVRENGAVILSLPSAEKITLPPFEEFLSLPTEIIIAFFNVSVQIDSANQEIRIRRIVPTERQIVSTNKKEKSIEIYQADYDYRLDRYSAVTNHNLLLNLTGRVGENRFSLRLNNSTGNRANPFWQPQSGTLEVARPNGQQFTAGDFSTSSNLLFLQTPIQGLGVSAPAFGGRISFFGGQSRSRWYDRLYDDAGHMYLEKRDTLMAGSTLSFENSDPRRQTGIKPDTSFGAIVFRNKGAGTGYMLTGNSRFSTQNAALRVNLATSGFGNEQTAGDDNAFGFAADFSGNVKLSKRLTLQGHFLNVSSDFKSVRSFQHYPQISYGGGASWRPFTWLNTSVNASVSDRTDVPSAKTQSVLTTLNIAPRNRSLPTVYFSHLETSSNLFRRGRITHLNVTKDFSRLQLFTNLTRAQIIGPANTNVQIGTRVRNVFGGFFQASQSFGSRGTLAGNVDWSSGENISKRLSFSGGIGYFRNSNGELFPTQRASASIRLPKRTTLQANYYNTPVGYQLMISLRGSFFSSKSGSDFTMEPNQPIERFSSVSGRVFQDLNENGIYDADIDTPQTDVRLRMESGQTAITDKFGFYSFSRIRGGEHKIILDPLTIRADLTMIDEQEVDLVLLPMQEIQVDFRLVRTGQISGTVWLDENKNGLFDEGEKPLADVRVIAGNGHDTLTGTDGIFTIGDLPPGEYVIFIDEKTLPENYKTALETTTFKVTEGKRVSDVLLPVVPKPPIVKTF